MNKHFLTIENYTPFQNSAIRKTGARPRSAPPRWRPACKAPPPSTLTRTSFARLALADTRRHTPDYDATLTQYRLDAHGVARACSPASWAPTTVSSGRGARAAAGLRGVAVVSPDIAAADLLALAEAGVAGIRLNLIGLPLPALDQPPGSPAQPDRPAPPALDQPAWQELLAHVNTLGWHVGASAGEPPACYHAGPAGCRLPRVIDHFGRPDPALGIADPGFAYLLRQADSGQVALAAPFAGGREAARLLDAYTPDRLMGSDWPHTEHRHLASYTAATQWLDAWIDDAAARQAVLADTPLRLFQFTGEAR